MRRLKEKWLFRFSWALVYIGFFILLMIFYEKYLKEPVKPCSKFEDFSKAHWPNHLENECFPKMHNKCCNIIKGDKGGLTCYGVAIGYNHPFFKYLKGLGYNLTKINPKEVRKIDSSHIEPYAKMKIYEGYYKGPKIGSLALDLRQVVFDQAVHAGPGRAVKILQKACGLKEDGIIGANTIKCSKTRVTDLIYTRYRKEWLRTRPSWKENKKGFKARLDRQHEQTQFSIKNSCIKE